MRILLVAPAQENLNLAVEINGVVNSHAHEVHLLSGTVVEQDVERECSEGSYEILWFASHGGPEGIALSDGQMLTVEALVPYVRQSGAELVFINTCSSLELANNISQQTGADIICTIRNVPDRMAMRTGVSFSKQLAKGYDYRSAYENSKPGNNRVYLYITNAGSARQGAKMSDQPNPNYNGKQIDRLTVSVDEMRRQLGSMESQMGSRIAVLEYKVGQSRDQMDKLEKDIEELSDLISGTRSMPRGADIKWQNLAVLFAASMILLMLATLVLFYLGR